MDPVSKSSRSREWERQRRNKFNDAISKLGEIVRTINKANDPDGKDGDNIQIPKIEIVQKAIICLTNCAQEKTQMKAEILALQVKLDDFELKKRNVKDAATQVLCIGINQKKQKSKCVKMMKLQKSKRNALKEKTVLTPNVKIQTNNDSTKSTSKEAVQKKLPVLLPNLNKDKKGPENTIVVLPATPYIFPQRPLLFPTLPPTIVLVDSNLQALNKPSVPKVNRSSGDVTKTTMVNILPISAYSRPLSATKYKKTVSKSKNDTTKKMCKKSKSPLKEIKEQVVNNGTNTKKSSNVESVNTSSKNDENLITDDNQTKTDKTVKNIIECSEISEKVDIASSVKKSSVTPSLAADGGEADRKPKTKNDISSSKCLEPTAVSKTPTDSQNTVTNAKNTNNAQTNEENTDKLNKDGLVKESFREDKDKENKLPNILDSSLCENVVDAGNARLELAEEFLAASPTAAFLMSFPLVSGNRADSPAEEAQNVIQASIKDSSQRRSETTTQSLSSNFHGEVKTDVNYFDKPTTSDIKTKAINKAAPPSSQINKLNSQPKYVNNNNSIINKETNKTSVATGVTTITNENPFLNLPMPSLISTSSTIADPTFGLDFDCTISKSISNQPANYATSSNIFYKSDPFNSVKSTIYSTSSISSGHEFNSLGLYPCAMEKYTSKNKSDYGTVEDNLMKIGSSRLTYDIDLGWSHKSFDFVGCSTAANTFSKDNILTTVSAPYSNSYNPFNPEFHVPLVSNANKKENTSSKPSSSFAETISSFYSQPTSLWTEDVPFYTNNNMSKSLTTKHANYLPVDHTITNVNNKPSNKHYETKHHSEAAMENIKSTNMSVAQIPEKYTKKSPTKMHINWMTSEIRPMQSNCISSHVDGKETHKTPYSNLEHVSKKPDPNESTYFPISVHNFPTQSTLEDLQVWPTTRPVGPTEISIEPPPINLPTLVGDLALGPHDKKKNAELSNRGLLPQGDIQNCGNFLSVTQLMNRSSDMTSRYQVSNAVEPPKTIAKQPATHFPNDRKAMISRVENQQSQPCYVFNEAKTINSYESMNQFSLNKNKANKSDKSAKSQKNSYSAESLIRGGTCTQKVQDSNNAMKFMMPTQKYNNFNASQDNSIAQVSHFPPIIDYSDNNYTSQQFSGTTLYNTTNTISNSFYTNLMPTSSNLMSSNYTGGPFSGEFMDYNQTAECNYTNHKYEELKIRNNATVYHQDKVPSSYKSSRRESAAKHKLECSKKDTNKKYQSKRAKLNTEPEEWSDPSHVLWQNKAPSKRHSNLMSEEISFPNYVGNQMPGQYQPDFFNSHLMPSNVQGVGHNVDRSLTNFPVTSRANFNLSTIFPEITMKVQ